MVYLGPQIGGFVRLRRKEVFFKKEEEDENKERMGKEYIDFSNRNDLDVDCGSVFSQRRRRLF